MSAGGQRLHGAVGFAGGNTRVDMGIDTRVDGPDDAPVEQGVVDLRLMQHSCVGLPAEQPSQGLGATPARGSHRQLSGRAEHGAQAVYYLAAEATRSGDTQRAVSDGKRGGVGRQLALAAEVLKTGRMGTTPRHAAAAHLPVPRPITTWRLRASAGGCAKAQLSPRRHEPRSLQWRHTGGDKGTGAGCGSEQWAAAATAPLTSSPPPPLLLLPAAVAAAAAA
jgi:hypothetical protein